MAKDKEEINKLLQKAQKGQILLDEWEEYFKPVFKDDEEARFDHYNDALEYVSKRYDNKPYQHIWAVVEGDKGKLILLNGYHKVNVLHFVVCDIPWGTGENSDKKIYIESKYE